VAAETTGGGYQNMRKYEMVVILDPSVDERTVTGQPSSLELGSLKPKTLMRIEVKFTSIPFL
jgi:hypothetical protein